MLPSGIGRCLSNKVLTPLANLVIIHTTREHTMEDLKKYYGAGQKAYMAGKPITSNPYPISAWNAYHGLWKSGWQSIARQVNGEFHA